MQFSYIIVDISGNGSAIKAKMDDFASFSCIAICDSKEEGVNKILELKPQIIFLSIGTGASESLGSFSLISELNEFLDQLPSIIVVSDTKETAYDAFQRGVSGFLLRPIDSNALRKCLYRYQKNHQPAISSNICIKSQGDYHFIKAQDIVYLKADNNTTDFYLESGKVITAYKTMKYYENLLPAHFYRIHHSYVVNIEFVSRINIGKADCYLSNNRIILPFSRTYKRNIDAIIMKMM